MPKQKTESKRTTKKSGKPQAYRKTRWLLEAVLAPGQADHAVYRAGVWYTMNFDGGFSVDDGNGIASYCAVFETIPDAKLRIRLAKGRWEEETGRRWSYLVSHLRQSGGKTARVVTLWG